MYKLALSLIASALVAVAAGTVSARVGPPAPDALWVDGELYRTVGTPTELPDRGPKDGIFAFTNLDGQRAVAEAAPGDRDYNGGRWEVYLLAFTEEGLEVHDADGDGMADFELESWEEVLFHIEVLGHLEVVGMGSSFECPVIPRTR